jgi:hypothetical protein
MTRARRPVCDTTVRTTAVIRGRTLRLQRDWLHGLWSWVVHDGDKKLGWVLQKFEGRKWGCVGVDDDPYDDIWYEYDSRDQALQYLLPKEQTA